VFSNFSVDQVERVAKIAPVSSHQPPYSMFRRGIERALLPYCAANSIGIVAYSPMQAGLLTGKFSMERLASLPEDDWRRGNEHFRLPLFERHLRKVERLDEIARDCGRSIAEMAIAWVLRKTGVTAAIVGARRPGQIEETYAASGWRLPDGIIDSIETVLSSP